MDTSCRFRLVMGRVLPTEPAAALLSGRLPSLRRDNPADTVQ